MNVVESMVSSPWPPPSPPAAAEVLLPVRENAEGTPPLPSPSESTAAEGQQASLVMLTLILYLLILTVSSVLLTARLISSLICLSPSTTTTSLSYLSSCSGVSTAVLYGRQTSASLRRSWAAAVTRLPQPLSTLYSLLLHICDFDSLTASQYDLLHCNQIKESLSTSTSITLSSSSSSSSAIREKLPPQRVMSSEGKSTNDSGTCGDQQHHHLHYHHLCHPHFSAHCYHRPSTITTAKTSTSSGSGHHLVIHLSVDLLWCAFLLLLAGLLFVPVSIRAAIRPSCRCVVFDDTYGKEYGIFTSPDWPTPYDDNTDCLLYTFQAPSDAIVEINFDEFDVQRNEEVG